MANNIIIQFTQDEFTTLLKTCIVESLEHTDFSKGEPRDKLFNVREASEYLDIAPQTLYGYTSNRTIPFIKKGKKLYFRKCDLDEWLSQGRKLTIAEIGDALFKKEKGGKHG
jgi:excisionase family DNA binding protein